MLITKVDRNDLQEILGLSENVNSTCKVKFHTED